MLSNVFLKSLRDQRKSLLFWGIGVGVLMLLTLLFYPSFSDMPELSDIFEDSDVLARVFAGGFTDLTSPEGYLNSQLFVLALPILFLIFAIAQGSGAIAGEEERGTLDLLLSNPLTRSRVALETFAAMIVAILVLALAVWLGMAIGAIAVDMDISFGRMAEATLSAALLGMAFGTLALAIGCVRGKRGLSIGVTSTFGVAAYFVNALAPMVEALEPFSKLSPFYYYISSDPLTNGLNFAHTAVLIGLVIVLLAVALITVERRDLGV